MKNSSVAILEIGSQKITCVVGQKGVNNTFMIKSLAECDYEGFSDGEFFDINSLAKACKTVISNANKDSRSTINKIYVGVPNEFSIIKLRDNSISFPRKKRISEKEINALHSRYALSDKSDYRIIEISAVYYVLDDNRRVDKPLHLISSKLGGLLTYTLCDKYFYNLLSNICHKCGVREVKFISEGLTMSKYLFSFDEREEQQILVDVGYLTTSVDIIRGNGLVYHDHFSFGGGHITAQLMSELNIDFSIAEQLKRNINLGYDLDNDGDYQLALGDNDYNIPLQKSNMVVRFCLDNLAEGIDNVLKECNISLPVNIRISLTGGGISYIRGSKEYLSTRIEMGVNSVVPKLPFMDKPEMSAMISLLNGAIEIENNN